MDPLEGTFLKVNVDRLDVRIYIIFNLVYRLRNVQQLALLLPALSSRCSCRLAIPGIFFSSSPVKSCRTTTNFRLATAQAVRKATCSRGNRHLQVWYSLISGEVNHSVHLIQLNLNSRLMPMWLDRQRSRLRAKRANF